ncbi:hypothetical protein CSW62_17945 [Caulobacter sp. FWC2]|nr:hypothetical protein CSW62_17945 [Caulobacter sp. FWC2]
MGFDRLVDAGPCRLRSVLGRPQEHPRGDGRLRCSPATRGSCRGATEGASWKLAELAPSGPLGHLPRDAGEDLHFPSGALASARSQSLQRIRTNV